VDFAGHRRRARMAEVILTPLIDVVFNLLIFFLITTTFVQNPGIDVDLPKATDAPIQPNADSVIIAITADGRVIHEGRVVSTDELREQLVRHHEQRADAMVIIQGDAKTDHGKVVEVMDIARQVGFRQLAIATEAEP
jgi:biopolymer transport protein ExbD